MSVSISVVTPSLNQASYVEETIASVLHGSDRPDEYVIVDGGSSDGTAAIVASYSDVVTWWVSEPDGGQYDAIAKGFAQTTGDVMAWLNAGDLYMPWTISLVRELFEQFPEVDWLTSQRPMIADEAGRVVACEFVGGFARDSFRARVNLPGGPWFARAGIQQESTFWRRSLWTQAGGVFSDSLQLAGDFELWLRFFRHTDLVTVDAPLAAHRVHPGQKTETLDAYVAEAASVLERDALRPPRRAASKARALLYGVLGRRPLRKLPGATVLASTPFLHSTRTLVWRDGSWRAVADYAV